MVVAMAAGVAAVILVEAEVVDSTAVVPMVGSTAATTVEADISVALTVVARTAECTAAVMLDIILRLRILGHGKAIAAHGMLRRDGTDSQERAEAPVRVRQVDRLGLPWLPDLVLERLPMPRLLTETGMALEPPTARLRLLMLA